MDPNAAAATTGLILAAVYAAECAWWPFAKCWCCHGTGKHARNDGKVFRDCRWCRGSGRRLRIGRRVTNVVTRARRDAQR